MSSASTVLIVDSDEAALDRLVELFRDNGYQATGAAGFDVAKRLLDTTHYDLLVASVRLMAYNGLHLVARSRTFQPLMAAIVLTSFPDPVTKSEARRLGAGYLVTPVDPKRLLALVREALAQVQTPESSASISKLPKVNCLV